MQALIKYLCDSLSYSLNETLMPFGWKSHEINSITEGVLYGKTTAELHRREIIIKKELVT